MPRIFDNVENSLSLYNVLLTSLETASHADFCVGYFRLAAWRKIASLIEKFSGGEAACCRLLVGMEKDSIEVVDPLVKEDFADALLQFRDQIQSKKVFIKCGNHSLVHAKLYLIHSNGPDNPPLSIVGSSNLTSNGLARPNELNVDFLDHDACNKLQAWFNQRWDEREDMSERVIERIDKHLKVDGCD